MPSTYNDRLDRLTHKQLHASGQDGVQGTYQPITLAYAEVTASQTLTANADLTGLVVTITVPAGRRIRITGKCNFDNDNVGNNYGTLAIMEGATELNTAYAGLLANGQLGEENTVIVEHVFSPTAGTHTYKLQARGTVFNLVATATATRPSFILVEDITGSSQAYPSASVPVGVLAQAQLTADQTGIGTSLTNVTSLVANVVIPAGRVLRVTTKVMLFSGTTGSLQEIEILDNGVRVQWEQITMGTGTTPTSAVAVLSPSAGAHTYQVRVKAGTGTVSVAGGIGSGYYGILVVEDITPTPSTAQGAPSSTLAYAEVLTVQSSVTTVVDIAGLTATVTVPAGRRIKVTASLLLSSTVAGDRIRATIKEGATVLEFLDVTAPVVNATEAVQRSVVLSPSAGTHTYKVTLERLTGTGLISNYGDPTFPAYLLVEDITGSVWPAGSQVTAGLIASEVWNTYVPVLTAQTTNPTMGAGAVASGRYQKIGRVVTCQFYIKFGSSGTNQGSGIYRISLPVVSAPAASAPTRVSSFPVGIGWGFNGVNNLTYAGIELVAAGPGGIVDRIEMRPVTTPGTITAFTDAVPFVWGANMELIGSLTYEAAA